GTDDDKNKMPPHRQAANYYKDVVKELRGEFLVTMEEPKTWAPKPIEIEITGMGFKRILSTAGAAAAAAVIPPRAG
ncbi:MAG: hypothetical protein JNK21_16555, partial [Rhodospirillaceae bacterium]|nr:hypothetical protein [Rhodospirillaceae bacterium]